MKGGAGNISNVNLIHRRNKDEKRRYNNKIQRKQLHFMNPIKLYICSPFLMVLLLLVLVPEISVGNN